MVSTHDIPQDAGRSWWLRDALAVDAGEPSPPLDGDTTADVVILGGGYTGMWTAWFLKERDPGLDVVLLEQDICGGGASGRNGGFVNSWWSGFAELCRRFGDDRALALCDAGEESVRGIGRFLDDHGIDAWFRPDGDLGVASSEQQIGHWADTVMAAERVGRPGLFEALTREETRARVNSPRMHGGIYTPNGATVQPARLARGLRRVLLELGIRIHERTTVTRFGAGSPLGRSKRGLR
jgi:glycine/D-amino acid oxidase-like deaminating enzyme